MMRTRVAGWPLPTPSASSPLAPAATILFESSDEEEPFAISCQWDTASRELPPPQSFEGTDLPLVAPQLPAPRSISSISTGSNETLEAQAQDGASSRPPHTCADSAETAAQGGSCVGSAVQGHLHPSIPKALPQPQQLQPAPATNAKHWLPPVPELNEIALDLSAAPDTLQVDTCTQSSTAADSVERHRWSPSDELLDAQLRRRARTDSSSDASTVNIPSPSSDPFSARAALPATDPSPIMCDPSARRASMPPRQRSASGLLPAPPLASSADAANESVQHVLRRLAQSSPIVDGCSGSFGGHRVNMSLPIIPDGFHIDVHEGSGGGSRRSSAGTESHRGSSAEDVAAPSGQSMSDGAGSPAAQSAHHADSICVDTWQSEEASGGTDDGAGGPSPSAAAATSGSPAAAGSATLGWLAGPSKTSSRMQGSGAAVRDLLGRPCFAFLHC